MNYRTKTKWFAAWCIGIWLFTLSVLAAAQTSDVPVIDERANDSSAITLEYMIVPEVGAEATFFISEISYMEMTDPTGLFQLVPLDDFSEVSIHAVRVRYTALQADPLTNHPRLLAEAEPVDPDTAEPLGGIRWEAVYQLTPDGVVQESGSVVPSGYADLVSPNWLVGWTISPHDELPAGAIEPGAEWFSTPILDFAELSFGLMALPVVGEFSGWVEIPGTDELAAHVTETLLGEGSIEAHEFGPGVYGNADYSLIGGMDYWLKPGTFPHQAENFLVGEIFFAIDPTLTGTTGMTGTFVMQLYFEKSIVLDTLGVEWLESGESNELEPTEVEIGQVITGALHPWSLQLGDGTYAELYIFSGQAGDEVRVRLESNQFDAYLFLLDDQDSVLASDDDAAGGTNAEIRHVLPYTGQYVIIVNSYFEDEYGEYTLGVLPADAPASDPVLVPGLPHHGILDRATSFQFEDGSFANFYTFYGVEGQEVTVHLESNAFDAYLILFDDTDTIIEDDDSGGGTDAFLRYTLPYTGNYYVVANTYFPGELGEYTLTLNVDGTSNAVVAEAISLLEKWQSGTASTQDFARMEVVLAELLVDVQQRLIAD